MKVQWIRGHERLDFSKASVWFVQGIRDSGKSSFLESLAEIYLQEGCATLDLFGSRDGESLAFLRSQFVKDKKFLLLKGENVDVEAPCDVKNATSFNLDDLEKYDLILNTSPCYSSLGDEYVNSAEIMDRIYKRLHWKKMVYVIMREASNYLYSRLKLSEDQSDAKTNMIYTLREMRHCGITFGLDSVRFYSVDIDIRNLSDYLVLKAQGLAGLAKDMRWLYRLITPPSLQAMHKDKFVMLTKKGNVSIGSFDSIPWHKQESEDIMRAVGVKVEYGEVIEKGQNFGTFKTVGDNEHSTVIDHYRQGLSMIDIGHKMKRSPATVKSHVDGHNKSIKRSGFCAACRRVKSQHEQELAVKP